MPVGHEGDFSKHRANEKVAILEFMEARLKDIVFNDPNALTMFTNYVNDLHERYNLPEDIVGRLNALDEDTKKMIMADLIVKVYDPFSTERDFYILLDVNWAKYEEIYGQYYNELIHRDFEEAVDDKYREDYPEIYALIHGGNPPNGVFNASSSKSTILHTISEMREIITPKYK